MKPRPPQGILDAPTGIHYAKWVFPGVFTSLDASSFSLGSRVIYHKSPIPCYSAPGSRKPVRVLRQWQRSLHPCHPTCSRIIESTLLLSFCFFSSVDGDNNWLRQTSPLFLISLAILISLASLPSHWSSVIFNLETIECKNEDFARSTGLDMISTWPIKENMYFEWNTCSDRTLTNL